MTYEQLDIRSNQFAQGLIKQGLQPGDHVGVSMSRCADMVAAIFGCWKVGAVYVPLDPAYPDSRLTFMLENARIGFVITEEYLAAQLPLINTQILTPADADRFPVAPFTCNPDPDSAAYMIYTSGSTGKPKGVLVSHRALANKLASLAAHYRLTPQDRGLLFASMSFDASLSQLLLPLYAGGCVVIRPDEIQEPEELMHFVCDEKVTVMHVVPAYLSQLLDAGQWCESALRIVISGGDVMSRSLQRNWFEGAQSGARREMALYNSYGPTECCITTSSHRVSRDDGQIPIGAPLGGVSYHVLGESGQMMPVGAVGELYIGGESLAEGYWKEASLTAVHFVTSKTGQERLYRSGDRVRWNEAGVLEFIGRRDRQVKVRGYRVELGELEAALTALPAVETAVVKYEEESLWAYVSLREGSLAEVRAQLTEVLPGYIQPEGYEEVKTWPLSASGKIERQQLHRGMSQQEAVTEPRNEIEAGLAGIWKTLLKRETVSIADNFFQLGGHSLLATRLAAQIRNEFGVSFNLRSLFEAPSIEEQAKLLSVLLNNSSLKNNNGNSVVEEFSL